MASWHPHDEAWSGMERRQESALGLCSCGRQYPDALSEEWGVCAVCDLEQEAASDPTGYAMFMHEEAYERAHPVHACTDDRWMPEFGCRACEKEAS